MAWVWLAIAAVFEICFALGSNVAQGFTRLWPSVLTIAAAAGGIFTLSLALRRIDVAVGYTIWTGVGALGAVLFGRILFGERLTPSKIVSFVAIAVGVIGLRLTAG